MQPPMADRSMIADCPRPNNDVGLLAGLAPIVSPAARLIVRGHAPKPPRFDAALHAAAAQADMALDAGGHIARKSLLPPPMAS